METNGTIVDQQAYHSGGAIGGISNSAPSQLKVGAKAMSREQKSNKETKKEPSMTAKEKKAAKKAKKNERGRIGE